MYCAMQPSNLQRDGFEHCKDKARKCWETRSHAGAKTIAPEGYDTMCLVGK